MLIVRPEKSEESPLVEEIIRRAYGREDEIRMLAALRGTPDFIPQLSLVADEEGSLRGYALFMKAAVEAASSVHSAASLMMLAVHPEHRKQGVGERLIRHGGERCRSLGREIIFVFGDFGYFSRVGFKLAQDLNLTSDIVHPQMPLLTLDLAGRLAAAGSGTVHYPQILRRM
ncbi:MAG: N-acetyltransferase [Elusimicrobiota bacterium]|jgi:putative acetyltransferase